MGMQHICFSSFFQHLSISLDCHFKNRCVIIVKVSVSDPYSLNPDPDPAKNLNPDPDPVPDPSYFLPLSEFFFYYFIIIRFSYQKKSIEGQNVVKVTKKLKECCKIH